MYLFRIYLNIFTRAAAEIGRRDKAKVNTETRRKPCYAHCNLTPATAHTMSLLVKKRSHGSPPVSSCPVIRAEILPTEQKTLPPAKPRGKRLPWPLRTHLIFLCYLVEHRPLKTAWQYYNEGTYAPAPRHSVSCENIGMEIIDREREKEWLEQMDTILIFVCTISF
jgi:hypothetical protein